MPTAVKKPTITARSVREQLPVGFHFGIASREDQDKLLVAIGQLVALEKNAQDSRELDELIQDARAQAVQLVDIRRQHHELREQYRFHEQYAPDADGNLAEAELRESDARAELAAAQEKHHKAVAAAKEAKEIKRKVDEAAAAIGTNCLVHATALKTWLGTR